MLKTEHLFSKKYLKKRGGARKKKGGADDNEDEEVRVVTIEPNTTIGENNMVEVDVPDDNEDEELEEVQGDNGDKEDGEEDQGDNDEEDQGKQGEEELEITDDEEDDERKTVKKDKSQKLLPQLFGFRDQMKLYHWQTLSHARHVASDTFVTNLSAFIDQFIEIYQGKYGRIKLGKVSTVRLEDIDDDYIIDYLKKYRNYLTFTLSGSLHNKKDTDLLNICDEMLADVNKTLYLFSLK